METSNPLLKREGAFASAWAQAEPMTLQGSINKTGILLLLCVGAAGYSWTHPELRGPLVLVGLLGGLIACLVGTFKPATSPIAAPVYAVLEGLALGAISQMFEIRAPGIVVNAMLLTFGVLAVMLMLYTSRTIRVTDKLVKGIFAATGAVLLVYVVDMLLTMFGVRMPLIHESGWLGIGISVQWLAEVHGMVLWDGVAGHAGVVVPRTAPVAIETAVEGLTGLSAKCWY